MSSEGFDVDALQEEVYELRDRVLTLEKYFAELAKWTYFIPLKKFPNNYGVAVPSSVAKVVVSEDFVGTGNPQINRNEEEDFEDEAMIENDYETPPQSPNSEEDSSMELEDCIEEIEVYTPSGGSVDVDGGVDAGSKDYEGTPQQMKTADKTSYIIAEDEHDHDDDSSDDDFAFDDLDLSIDEDFPAAKKSRPKKKSAAVTLNRSPQQSAGKLKCPHCPKRFPLRYTLRLHIRSHTGERPFSCPHCPHATSQAGHLREHIRRTHNKGVQNSICCGECGLKFPSHSTLKAHRKSCSCGAADVQLQPMKKRQVATQTAPTA